MHFLILAAQLLTQEASTSMSFGVAKFGGSGQCGTSDMTHDVHEDSAKAFSSIFNFFTAMQLWDGAATHLNTSVKARDWTDASNASYGADNASYGVDHFDVAFIHTHGSHNSAGSSIAMGSNVNSCNVSTATQVGLGNGDLDIAIVKACQSADYNTWKSGAYWSMINGGEFRLWNGFHGNSSCGGDVVDYVIDYTNESMSDGVGENWLDEAYDSWGADDCPVSIVFGETRALRERFYRYAGFRDRKSTGSKVGTTYFYVKGCDPSAGVELPD